VHGYRLSQEALGEQIARLRVGNQAARERIIGLDPRRADVILAGALILQRIAIAAQATEIQVSDRGIRWGLMHELAHKFAAPGLA
jgi:exopolyphosphatase/guanosine-5'-triphosphate,3'-diphosphate pyrophosphatase